MCFRANAVWQHLAATSVVHRPKRLAVSLAQPKELKVSQGLVDHCQMISRANGLTFRLKPKVDYGPFFQFNNDPEDDGVSVNRINTEPANSLAVSFCVGLPAVHLIVKTTKSSRWTISTR